MQCTILRFTFRYSSSNNNRDVERKNGGFDDEVGLHFPPILSTTVFELSMGVWAWSGVIV